MAQLHRGIAPELLLSQIRNTMPYVFGPEGAPETLLGQLPPVRLVREADQDPAKPLSHAGYFQLCLSAHYLTCGTPVPTDVDNQIRLKLWPKELPLEAALEMAEWVRSCRSWDFSQVTTRMSPGARGTKWEHEFLAGHLGEWFTVAAGAYCGLGQYAAAETKKVRQDLFDAIADEVKRHSEIFGSLWNGGDGLNALKASASIAHNFGDLDRVMDMWELRVDDPLRLGFYRLGITPFDPDRKLRYFGRLWVAGELYKAVLPNCGSMAFENHRHFALRKPRCLRQSPSLLIPIGPFFDAWGERVGRLVSDSDADEVVEALRHGWERLPNSVGYARALHGMRRAKPAIEISDLLKKGPVKRLLETPQDRFEEKWAAAALTCMEEIPSRA